MKHLIMGTAGHIDHGKTALVRALTGIECDTHRQEKERGITINLGFAFLTMPGGETVGIVDVPGHKNFVNTMVGGASGIDFACLVVAANEGVMPQTREHLQIMEVLGIRGGLIALTKTDLVDEEIAEMAAEEVRELTVDTPLEGAPLIPVSSKTGTGMESLRQAIADQIERTEQRAEGEVFRLFVDRIFSVAGFGTVVTGSVIGGRLRTGDTAWLLPGDRQVRVRRMERHSREVEEVSTGDRASLNLVGLERDEFHRGMIVADRQLRATTRIDARLRFFDHGREAGIWSHSQFLAGTYEAQARVHLLDRNRLRSGETALVQIELPHPCVLQAGDRFVLRTSSADLTLGGGEIIDAAPLHHRRRPPELIDRLRRIAEGKLPELIGAEVRKRPFGVSTRTLAGDLNVSTGDIEEAISCGLSDEIVVAAWNEQRYLIARQHHDRMIDSTRRAIAAYHRRNPLETGGRTVEELLGIVGIAPDSDGALVLRALLERGVREGTFKKVDHTWALSEHTVSIGPELRAGIERVEEFLRASGMKVPLMSELSDVTAAAGIDRKKLDQILRYLSNRGVIYATEGSYLHAEIVDPIRRRLLEALAGREQGMTVAGFRDLISGNRKLCLALYALFDSEGLTERAGDVRIITERGRAWLETF